MTSPLARFRFGVVVLALVCVTAYSGYLASGYGLVEALWMLVITISTVGYAEHSTESAGFQMFSVFVIVFGISAAAYTFGGFVQMVVEGELTRFLGQRRMSREIERTEDHVIICGYGRIGRMLAAGLARQGYATVVIDADSEVVAEAQDNSLLGLNGDATDEDILLEAGVERARVLVSGLPSDADNVFITLTAHTLNPDLRIIARADHQRSEKKLMQAGAAKVVMPTIIGAHQIERIITRPTTADLMALVSESSFMDVELDELVITPNSKLLGVSVRDTAVLRNYHLLVVATKRPDGEMVFGPAADHVFLEGEVIIVMGRADDIVRLRKEALKDGA